VELAFFLKGFAVLKWNLYLCAKNQRIMDLIQVINRQPGSICWAAFLKLAALLAKPPTFF
jgi:hypothetical protein